MKSEQIIEVSEKLLKKNYAVIGKIIGAKTIKNILSILEGKVTSYYNLIFEELNDTMTHLKFASMT